MRGAESMVAKPSTKKTFKISTIGHSTRPFAEFVQLLKKNNVTLLVDVRTIPKSRTNPQFNKDTLAMDLNKEEIKYMHFAQLGGLRHAKKDSANTVWENASFRVYADYMETEDFRGGIKDLLSFATVETIAIMCSESVWWRCHRSMIADELVAEGYSVGHIMNVQEPKPHTLRSFAHVDHGHVSYH